MKMSMYCKRCSSSDFEVTKQHYINGTLYAEERKCTRCASFERTDTTINSDLIYAMKLVLEESQNNHWRK